MTLFKQLPILKIFKGILITVALVGTWHISARYTEASFLKEKEALTAKALETTKQRLELARLIGQDLDKRLANRKVVQQVITQKVIHEIQKEPIYTDCRTTPNGVRLIEDAIDNRGTSRTN